MADVAGIEIPTGHLIGGEWVDSPATFETRSPIDWDGMHLADIARGDAAIADAAVTAAIDGFSEWGSWEPAQRAEVLRRLADLIEANTERRRSPTCRACGSVSGSRPRPSAPGSAPSPPPASRAPPCP